MNEIKVHVIPGMGRQGDVLILPSLKPFSDDDLGNPIIEENGKRVTLALGELTGHAHAFYPDMDVLDGLVATNDENIHARVTLFPLKNPSKYCKSTFTDGVRALRLTTRCFLRHEEHPYHSFPPGDYVVIQQHIGDEIEELIRTAD